MSHASPLWQGILFFVSGIFLLWEVWSGWRRGVVRSGIHFAAFVVSGVLGVAAGQATAFLVERILPGFGLIAGALIGSLTLLTVLGLALLVGALLFKKTSQQPSSVIRLLYGGGGALFGLLTGLFILWGGITIVRTLGVVAETAAGELPPAQRPAIIRGVVTLKDSLELGPAGKVVESVDAVPPGIYEMISRIGRLTSDQEAMMRFLDYPGMQEVMQDPHVAALLNDPDVVRAAQQRDFLALARNPALLAAVNNPGLQKKLSGLDLEKALDYAFPKPQASPSPHKKP